VAPVTTAVLLYEVRLAEDEVGVVGLLDLHRLELHGGAVLTFRMLSMF
jgi:hypothetical protein